MKPPDLPAPAPEAAAHSERVLGTVVERIRADGPLRFDAYWDLVLYEPGLGYYAAGTTKFGAAGDFVTAPELGPIFGRCVAGQIAAVLDELGGGDIVEYGAGTGAFAATTLERLAELGKLPERYRIVERSADLAARQRELLAAAVPNLLERVEWLEALPATPWRGVVFANEVLDALAARRLLHRDEAWFELHVGLDGDRLAWAPVPLPDDLRHAVDRIEACWDRTPTGDWLTEVQPSTAPWLAGAVEALEAGAVLLCDYGYDEREYFHPDRKRGTLICHYRHRAHDDPFHLPGLTDLSVSVNFGAVMRAMAAAGLSPDGYASQAQFLLAAGLEDEFQAAFERDAAEQIARVNEIKRLTLPAEMGERFRFIGGLKGALSGMPAFGR
ncbi:MAG: SAM-dependent methyltransferase [Pseudomonadota bacterium]